MTGSCSPGPDHLTPQDEATLTVQMALAPFDGAATGPCAAVEAPTVHVVEKDQVMTVRDGDVSVVYESAATASRPRELRPGSYVALAGPLTLRLTPVRSPQTVSTVCL